MPPAPPVDHLLIGQHRRAIRTPVHLAFLAISQPALEHAQKKPLIPAVVVRQAGRDFRRPVEPHPQPLKLALHGGNIGQRPLARRNIVLERRILRRQPKRVPPHGVHHVVAAHPHVPRQRVANGVVAHMPHVQLAAGIGQHLQHVKLRLAAVRRLGRIKRRVRRPPLLPLRFNRRRVVALFRLFRSKVFRHHPSSVNG
jgi:hypothetical protein